MRFALCPSPSSPRPWRLALGSWLQTYFRSGWAFLIPYLAAYLLYYWLKWPANPAGEGVVKGMNENGSAVSAPQSLVPCLLYIYWALHGIHVILGAIALRAWWKKKPEDGEQTSEVRRQTALRGLSSFPTHHSSLATRHSTDIVRLAPWLLLALLFYIPGVYLEWPADPWEHLRRITEWQIHPTVGTHSAGYKSFYFFPYSLVGWISPAHLLFWVNIYYTGMCLLLTWQYYLLAKAVGLDRRGAFLSVIVNVLTFGNVCFSFYRYYALASTIFAQIGAVALTRIALERLNHPRTTRANTNAWPQKAQRRTKALVPKTAWRSIYTAIFNTRHFSLVTHHWATAVLCLVALIAFNHVQGIGIGGLAIGSIIVWRLIEWRRSMAWWLGATAVILSIATMLWWPRHPYIDSHFRPEGWLNAWYGFNLFAWPSPTADRAMQILGLFGVVNVLAGILLLLRNHIVGWLTISPVLALSLPFVALPFANRIVDEPIVYHRMFFAIPSGLAIVALAQRRFSKASRQSSDHGPRTIARNALGSLSSQSALHSFSSLSSVLLLGLAFAVTIPASQIDFNRSWQVIARVPDDLQMKPVIFAAKVTMEHVPNAINSRLVAAPAIANIFNTVAPRRFPWSERIICEPATYSLNALIPLSLTAQPTVEPPTSALIRDPFTLVRAAWTSPSGTLPEFVVALNDFHASTTALQNPSGHIADVFTSDLIPIDPARDYQVEWSAIQRIGTEATAYLAVAWYSEEKQLLESYKPVPAGAGAPRGWSNGTYSYFGLKGQAAPTVWTTYRTSFGRSEIAEIPHNARFVRIGALLNYNQTPRAIIQLTDVNLWRKSKYDMMADGVFPSNERTLVVTVPSLMLRTYASQSGFISAHWSTQELASDLAGCFELLAATQAAGGAAIQKNRAILEVPPWGERLRRNAREPMLHIR